MHLFPSKNTEWTCLVLHIIKLNDQNNEMNVEGYDIFLISFPFNEMQKEKIPLSFYRLPRTLCSDDHYMFSLVKRQDGFANMIRFFLSMGFQVPMLMLS